MKKYLALTVAFSLPLIQALAWAEQGAVKPQTSPTELGKEQSEHHMSPIDQDREIKMIMLNQKLNKKGNAVTPLTNKIKQRHNTDQSIINNLK